MKYTVTFDLDNYEEAKLLLTIAGMIQSLDYKTGLIDLDVAHAATVPVAWALTRVSNLTGAWLMHALAYPKDFPGMQDILNFGDGMDMQSWVTAMHVMKRISAQFDEIIDSLPEESDLKKNYIRCVSLVSGHEGFTLK